MKTQLSGDVISIPEDPQVQPGLIQKRTALNEKYMYELFRSFRFNDTSSSKKIRCSENIRTEFQRARSIFSYSLIIEQKSAALRGKGMESGFKIVLQNPGIYKTLYL